MDDQTPPTDSDDLSVGEEVDVPSGMGDSDGKSRLDLKVDKPGTPSSAKALGLIRRSLTYAIGPIRMGHEDYHHLEPDRDDLLDELVARVAHAVRDYWPSRYGYQRSIASFRREAREGEPEPIHYLRGAVLGDGTDAAGDAVEGRATLDYLTVPRPWIARITSKRGRGKTRSRRPYWPAIHLYSYIVALYREPDLFRGPLLHLHARSVKTLLGLTEGEYSDAVHYLQDEGYITRVILRGWCPWDPRSKGVYVYVFPRVTKLRGVTRVPLSRS